MCNVHAHGDQPSGKDSKNKRISVVFSYRVSSTVHSKKVKEVFECEFDK